MWTVALGILLQGEPVLRIEPAPESNSIQKTAQLLTQSGARDQSDLQQRGLEQFYRGEFNQAIASFQAAIALANNPATVAHLYSQIGHSYANLGDYETALIMLDEAQSRYEQLALSTGLAEVNIYRGFVRRRQGNYGEALRLLEAAQSDLAVADNEEGESAAEIDQWQAILTGEALHNLAAVKAALGENEAAIALNNQALTIWETLQNVPPLTQQFHRGRSLNNLGGIYYTLGEVENAKTYYQQALTIAKEIGNRASEGRILTNLGQLERQAARPEAAAQRYQEALSVLTELGDRASISSTLNSLGIVYETLGEYDQALDSYGKSLAIAEEIGAREQIANSWDGLGGLHYRQSRYGKALSDYETALAIHQAIGNQRGMAATLTNLGGTYANLGRNETALGYFEQAFKLTEDPSIRAGILAAQGGVYSQLGKLPEALRVTQQGLDLAITAKDIPQQQYLLNQLGGIYGQQGQIEAAIAAYQRAIAVSEEQNDVAAVARSLNSWGSLIVNFATADGIAQAQPLFQSALTTFQQLGDRAGESIVLSNLGKIYEADGQTALAILFYKQAVNQHEAIRGDLRSLPNDLQQAYLDSITPTYRRLADLLLQQDRVLEAQRVIDLLKVQEVDDYVRGVRGNENTQAGVDVLASEGQIWDAYTELSEVAIAIAQDLAALRQLQRPLTPAEIQQKTELDRQQRQVVREFSEFSRRDDIIRYTETLSRTARAQSLSISSLQDLSQNLQDIEQPTVLIYPLILEDRLELILVAPGVPPIHKTVNVDRITLNETIQAFRSALTSPASDPLPAAQQLYDWLIRPLEPQLAQAQAKALLYAPDGPLRYVPLAALHDGDAWLIEQFSINNITAASLDDLTRQPPSDRRILAGAFSDAGTRYEVSRGEQTLSFNGLPYAGAEVEAIQILQPDSTAYFNPDFSKDHILPNMDDYPIVHLATHAAFLPGSPLDSFVLLGDGETITLQEVQDEWFFSNLDLIVLSACQTGLSSLGENGEEILGFGYLMQNAGVNAAVASLWTVDDGGTQALMTAFYTGLLTDGMSKAEALRQAQLTLIGAEAGTLTSSRGGLAPVAQGNESEAQTWNRLGHPYYWSPFILIGNGL